MTPSFDPAWEMNVYARGAQINRYPFSDLIGYVLRAYGERLRSGERPRALELGSGAGNNLVFLAAEGFESHGIDGSASACRIARELLRGRGLTAEIVQGDFVKLPYPDQHFDLIVDRAAVYCNRRADIAQIVSEVRRCLRPGGRFLSFVFADHGIDPASLGATMIEPGTFTGFTSGSFAATGIVHLFSEAEIAESYMAGFEIEFLHRIDKTRLRPSSGHEYAEYHVCGRRP